MENFIVSARKYRPVTFASVVGQQHITSTLKNAIGRKQIAHAYLFCGPRGVGKTTCARILAKAINCMDPSEDSEACNQCESCKAFHENRSFNIHELDAASNNSVDDIRALTEQVRVPPQIGRYSVYIIDETHMLSTAAFNAFLKTLEEPPAHAIFILATTEKHKIIPTILSRCQIYDFNRIRVEDGVKYLEYIASSEGVSFDDEALQIIARKADGGMRDALSMFDKVVSFCGNNLTATSVSESLNVLDYDSYFSLVRSILEGNYTDVLTQFDRILQKGFDIQQFLGGLNRHFRDLLVARNEHTLPLLEVTGSVARRYMGQAAEASLPFLFNAINLVAATDSGIKSATNPRLNTELCLLKLSSFGQKKNDLTEEAQPDPVFLDKVELPAIQNGKNTSPGDENLAPAATIPKADTKADSPIPDRPVEAAPVDKPASVTTTATVEMDPVATETVTIENGQTPQTAKPVKEPIPSSATVTPPASGSPVRENTTAQPQTAARPSITGISIQNIVTQAPSVADPAPHQQEEVAAPEKRMFTPQQIECLKTSCRNFAAELKEQRPRVAVAFEDAEVTDQGIIIAKAGSEILKEEMLNNKHELIRELSRICRVEGIDLEVNVVAPQENTRKLIVKPEDKFKHLAAKNKNLLLLCEELGLDIE